MAGLALILFVAADFCTTKVLSARLISSALFELSELMMGFVKSTRRYKLKVLPAFELGADEKINHRLHFVFTLLSFGLWGLVWWWLILKAKGKSDFIFSGFDDDYWSYLIEREQPPAALYRQQIAPVMVTVYFDA